MNVVVSGAAGSGKDTVADGICERLGYQKISLADPMKRFLMREFGFTAEELWGSSDRRQASRSFERGDVVARQALQTLGTEWGRQCLYEDVWVDRLFDAFTAMRTGWFDYEPERGLVPRRTGRTPPRGFVVSDVRFPNELEAIRGRPGFYDGTAIKVVGRETKLDEAAAGHASEHQDLSMFDLVIDNSDLTPRQSIELAVDHVRLSLPF